MRQPLPSPEQIRAALESASHALLPGLLPQSMCVTLRDLYEQPEGFRRTVDMAKHGFGRGQYRYFDQPLPEPVTALRRELHTLCAHTANGWANGEGGAYPTESETFLRLCHQHGQIHPTPLLLRYQAGDYNCLHQDTYGEICFPLQVVVLLSRPGEEFTGGELILTERRARRQSRPIVVPLSQGDAVVIPVTCRPETTPRGMRRVEVRHGVSEVRSGRRTSLGIIFHDAA
ncbi:MAG: 2OG-Fe(II) oxygenase [Pseudomonadales bacterium]